MKKFLMIPVIAALSTLTLQAQNTSTATMPPASGAQNKVENKGNKAKEHPKKMDATERAKKSTDRMAEKLSLTEEQKTKVYAINLDKAQKMDELHAKKGPDKKALGQERKALFEAKESEIKAVLTPEQIEKWNKMKEEKKNKMKNKKGKGGKGKPHDKGEDNHDEDDE